MKFFLQILKSSIFLFFLSFGRFNGSVAQNYSANIEVYNYENVKIGRHLNCTFKDSRGIMWIGDEYGISRFDGHGFLQLNKKSGLPIFSVGEIHEDSNGWLWLFTNCFSRNNCQKALGFIHSVSLETQTFQSFFEEQFNFEQEDIISLLGDDKGAIFITANRQIIQWSNGKVIKKIELSASEETPYLLGIIGEDKLAGWHYSTNENGKLIIIYKIYDADGAVLYKKIIPTKKINYKSVKALRFDKDYTGQRIITFETPRISPQRTFYIQNDGTLREDSSIWLGLTKKLDDINYHPHQPMVWGDDLQIHHKEKGLIYDFEERFPFFRKKMVIRQIHFDKNDITWVTWRGGLMKIQLKSDLFKRYYQTPTKFKTVISEQNSSTISALPSGKILAVFGGAVYLLESTSNNFLKLTGDVGIGRLKTFSKGYKGDYWAISRRRIVNVNPKTLKTNISKLSKDLMFTSINSSSPDGDRLWLATNNGLFYYDHKRQQIFPSLNKGPFGNLEKCIINFMHETEKGHFLLCTSKGLFSFSSKKDTLVRCNLQENGIEFLSDLNYQHIIKAKKGGYWIATSTGIIYWDPEKNEAQQYKDDLNTSKIRALYEDNYGFLWIATANGLIQSQISTGISKTWLEGEGISSQALKGTHSFLQKDSSLWIGCANGVISFQPKDFKDVDVNSIPDIPLNIIEYEQFSSKTNRLENLTLELIRNQEIVLNPKEQIFNLRVALADYTESNEIQYAYRIKGIQDFWQEGKENLIRISGLPYGDFELEIRARTSKGKYSSQEIHLPIRVLKPFYLKTWFFMLVGAVILNAFFFWFKWRTAQLKRSEQKLKQLVKERTKTIKQQAEELRTLDKLKSRFFANVSHELRTPLTLILGPISAALKRNRLDNRDFTFLKMAQQNGQQLLKLVNSILDFSKIEAGKLKLEEKPIVFHTLLRRLLAQYESNVAFHGIVLNFETDLNPHLQIQLDEVRFETILNNLISNAIKFTRRGGKINIKVQDLRNKIEVQVADTGRGIHPDDLPSIFDRFYQTKKENAKIEGGTGIGLALCREYAALFNGELRAESSLGVGSTFYFVFPKKIVMSVSSSELPPKQPADSTSITYDSQLTTDNPKLTTILLVEDNADLRKYIQTILSDQYNVITAENGQAALDRLRAFLPTTDSPQLIISDIMMPVMDGFELLGKLKADEQWKQIPVIMLTARAHIQDKLKALRIGVDDYLIKPFDTVELTARIDNLLQNYQARQIAAKEIELEEKKIPSSIEEVVILPKWLEDLEGLLEIHVANIDFSVEHLADLLSISHRQFFRQMKATTGLTPNQFVREFRLQKARKLIESGQYQTAKAVCQAIGFSKVAYFSELFKKRFGKTPSEYLANY